jgi:hypothetical protein
MSHFTMIDEIKRLEKENAELKLLLIEKLRQDYNKLVTAAQNFEKGMAQMQIERNEFRVRIEKALQFINEIDHESPVWFNVYANVLIEILEGKSSVDSKSTEEGKEVS